MAHRDEPKMDELKKLLRRLDGIEGDKGQKAQLPDQQGYVGALRGMPAGSGASGPSFAPAASTPAKSGSSRVAPYAAAATAAVVSTVTVFLLLAWQEQRRSQSLPLAKPDVRQPNAAGQGSSTDTPDGLVRRADILFQGGEIEAARTLLQRAAELGSSTAALKLGRSYDPAQTRSLNFADSQTNPALAKAWYQRALALGSQEAAGYLAQGGGQ